MRMIKFEIMTEDVTSETASLIAKLVLKYFPAFSVQRQIGYWSGEPENSLSIMIIAPKNKKNLVYVTADKIRSLGRQDCVLVVETKVKTELI